MSAHLSHRSDGTLDLHYLRKRSKALLKQLRAGTVYPQSSDFGARGMLKPEQFQLADAQWLIAREFGFASWPKLKAHVEAIEFAARNPPFPAECESDLTHWRCGNDIEHSLRLAGFRGRFQMLADPLVMGPVTPVWDKDYRTIRSHYLSRMFNLSLADAQGRLDHEYGAMEQLNENSRVVLWCEADPYDQLFLVRFLSGLQAIPQQLDLVEINALPGVQRFIGIGQLAPEVLAWLWKKKRSLSKSAISLAQRTWEAYCSPDPTRLAEIAYHSTEPLPLLGPALRRLLYELPGTDDGLSLTERLSLEYIAECGEISAGRIFAELTAKREPLPYLGDLMFYAMLRSLIDTPNPLLIQGDGERWPDKPLRLTPLGKSILDGNSYWLDEGAPERWLGGTCLRGGQPHWVVNKHGRPQQRG